MSTTEHLCRFEKAEEPRRRPGAVKTPISCRVCGRRLGVIRGFAGRVFTLCGACEQHLKSAAMKVER